MAFYSYSIPQKYFFESDSARDSYFATHASELADGIIVGVKSGTYYTLQKYIDEGAGTQPGGGADLTAIQDAIDALSARVDGKMDLDIMKKAWGTAHDGFQISSVEIEPDSTDAEHSAKFKLYFFNAETLASKVYTFKFKLDPTLSKFEYTAPSGSNFADGTIDQGGIKIATP
jgi:hypothetical protein